MACVTPHIVSVDGAATGSKPAQQAAEAVSACRQFLQRTTLRALMRPQQEIVTLTHSQTIGEALQAWSRALDTASWRSPTSQHRAWGWGLIPAVVISGHHLLA